MRVPSNVRLQSLLHTSKELRTLDHNKVSTIWYADGYQKQETVKQSVKWLHQFREQCNWPISIFPWQEYLYGLEKIPQFDLVNQGTEMSNHFKANRFDIDLIILFGPERYDALCAMAAQYLIPIAYIFTEELSEVEMKKILCDLPIYPYFTPFVTIYFADLVTSLSSELPNLPCFTKDIE